MLKVIVPLEKLIFIQLRDGNNEGDRFSINNSKKFIKKSRKLKNQNLSKSQKLFNLKKILLSKKLSKNRNLPKNNAIKKSSFLTFIAKTVFNRLQLAFTKASILQYFDLKCYIQMEINILGYVIGSLLR